MKEQWYQIRAAAQGDVEMYIYDSIGAWGISAQQFVKDCKAAGVYDARNLTIHIHSPGGDVMDGFAIYNILCRLTATINIYVDGIAASMASVIACLPQATLHMPENAWLMIHRPWGCVCGDSEDIRDYAAWLDGNEALLINVYAEKSGKSREEIAAMLAEETWMNGAEAVEMGFADVTEAPLEAAAAINENTMKDFHKMPEQLKTLFAPRGSTQVPPAAAQQPPVHPAPHTQPAPTGPEASQTLDISALAAELQQQLLVNNLTRQTAVRAVFDSFPAHATLLNECLADMVCDETQARDRLLKALAAGTTPTAGTYTHVHAGNGNIVGDNVRASILHRAGLAEAEQGNPYAWFTLRELARASLVDRGIGTASLDPMGIVAMAFTHSGSDFPGILIDVAHKSALQGWEQSEETFSLWTRKGTLTDFKVSNRVGLDAFPTLREVRPGAEYKYVTVGERGAKIVLATYGELFSIDRQTIINDDLHMILNLPRSMGSAARATIGDLVYAQLTGNPQMLDDEALFSDEHNNIVSGGMDVTTLDKARQKMRTQKAGNRTLNIRPAYVITPVALESRARQVIGSASIAGADVNSGISNPIKDFAEVIADPRLDDKNPNDYYLAAAQGRDTIEVAYLNGQDQPFIDQMNGFTADGVTMKVRIDAGVAPVDWLGLVKVSGTSATPAKSK